MFVEAVYPTPIFSEKNFPKFLLEDQVMTDHLGLFRPLEMIAFEGSCFEVIQRYKDEFSSDLLEIKFAPYSKSSSFFIDARFVRPCVDQINQFTLPKKEEILEKLLSLIGKKYIWGGNFPSGVPQMDEWYPLKDRKHLHKRTFQGVDCSGMLYHATQGGTPRNTCDLMYYGKTLPIEGFSMKAIKKKLRPLDLVVWKGHIFYVVDDQTAIESRVFRGCVYTSNLLERLERIYEEDLKIPKNDPGNKQGFVVRRWI